ncbi:hypothetical protein CHARACLAT_025461 [Characodon lateralis]|uniref:Uncharacterized protein n=1 Tax=Characodon lateralis TaxID=208331 RepID=A0ABU7D9W5_9TELE|nr:hypothetical protein [Characodon lateralis]
MLLWQPDTTAHLLGSSELHALKGQGSFGMKRRTNTLGHRGGGAFLQQSTGKRQGTPWTGCQSITGQHTTIHT